LTSEGEVASAGNFTANAGAGTFSASNTNIDTNAGAGSGSVQITAADIVVSNNSWINAGSVTLDAGGNISLGEGSWVWAETGNVTFNAGGSIALGNESGRGEIYSNNSGNISLTAVNDITLSNDSYVWSYGTPSGSISLTATSGSVSVDSSYLYTQGGDVTINAGNGITLGGTEVLTSEGEVASAGNFTANAGAGTFSASNTNIDTNAGAGSGSVQITAADIEVGDGSYIGAGSVTLIPSGTGRTIGLGAGTGDFSLTADELLSISTSGMVTIGNTSSGNITVDEIDSLNFSNLTLTTGGAVNDKGSDDTAIAISDLTINAAQGIGTTANPLNVNVDTLTASTANAHIHIAEADNVAINTINAGTGNVVLTAGEAITDNNAAENNITASNVTLSASLDIGSNTDPIEVTVPNTVNATSTSGGVFIVNLYVPPATPTTPLLLPANVLSSTLTNNGFTNTGYERAANADQRPATNEFTGYQDLQLNTITDSRITEDLGKADIETEMERRR